MAQNHVAALKALKAKSIVGATYFPEKLNEVFAKYLRDAGFDVLAMDGIDVPFDKVQELPAEQVYAHIKRNFLKPRAPTRSTCWARAGARSTSSKLEQDLRCRWCIR